MYRISPSKLSGQYRVPSSKSETLRAILFASLATGESIVQQFLPSPDTEAMIRAVTLLGAKVVKEDSDLKISGLGGIPQFAEDVIDCGNSGIVLRFIGALAGLIPNYTVLTGDASIRHNRIVTPLLDGLTQLGAQAVSSRGDGFSPIIIKGPITANCAIIDGTDSQPVSGLLIAAAFAPYPVEIRVLNPGEKPWIDLTLSWFDRLGIPYVRNGHRSFHLQGNAVVSPFTYQVPGDFSSAAFPICAALITDSDLTIHNLDMNQFQGDKAIIPILQKMGAQITVDNNQVIVRKGSRLRGVKIDINDFVDALPILSVVGCFAEGETEIVGAEVARNKESDRIDSMAQELTKMGAKIEQRSGGLIIKQSPLHGAALNSHRDHRILFSLSVAALAASGITTINGVSCGAKTIPNFHKDFQSLGANIEFDSIRI
jgi:3-phosphoshikimate 1-carboxyvinyltransferase